MGMFQGTLNYSNKNYHSFFIEDQTMEELGMAYYTINSIENYFVDNKKELSKIFGDNLSAVVQSLIGSGTNFAEQPAILKFDTVDTKKYIYTSFNSIINPNPYSSLNLLVKDHDTFQLKGSGAPSSTGDGNVSKTIEIVNHIQNSSSGCITFKPNLVINGQTRTPLVKLFFKEKTNNSNDRIITQKGAPVITEVARRSTGGKYGWRTTQQYSNLGVGVFSKISDGGSDNPNNTVTGSLRLSYNKALGMWESGTQQILARLLTDVDPAPITELPAIDDIDNIAPSSIYDVQNANYMSQFTIGIALPLSVHNANPHTFGPNSLRTVENGQQIANKKERIMVVNRAPRSFAKGSIVLCSLIDNEWIIQGFDIGQQQKPKPKNLKVGKWSFAKYIVDSDSYFKDARFYESNGTKYTTNITPSFYETSIRYSYYRSLFQEEGTNNIVLPLQPPYNSEDFKNMNDLAKIAKLNLYPNLSYNSAINSQLPSVTNFDFIASDRYFQSSAFDQVGTHMGGNNTVNILGRNNILYPPDGDEDQPPYYYKMGVFWGPIFPDGYNAGDYANFTSSQKIGFPVPLTTENTYLHSTTSTEVFTNDLEKNIFRPDGKTNSLMFSNTADTNLKQLPAEIGINGSLSGQYSSPIEDFTRIFIGLKNSTNDVNTFYNYLTSSNRYVYLATSGNSEFYGFNPVSPGRIQFSPLIAEFALYERKNTTFENAKILDSLFSNLNFVPFGNMATLARNPKFVSPLVFANEVKGPAPSPIAGPGIFPETNGKEKANVIGVIAAKNNFGSNGGTVTFNVTQRLGLYPQVSVAGGGGGGNTFLPIGPGIGWSDPGSPIRENRFPRWGSADDSYDSFGTTTLHVRVFDEWPSEQTIYDGRYFGILHFNKFLKPLYDNLGNNLRLGMGGLIKVETKDVGKTYTGEWDPENQPNLYNTTTLSQIKYQRNVDILECDLDFRIPTIGNPLDPSKDNKFVKAGALISKEGAYSSTDENAEYFGVLRPENEWRLNPIRRNQLLTGGGFRYFKRIIGIHPTVNANITVIEANGGSGYSVGDVITFAKGAKAVVKTIKQNGKVESIEFTITNDVYDIGEGYTSAELGNGIGITSVKKSNGSPATGTGLNHKCYFGITYDKLSKDQGPVEHGSITRLSIPSNRGEAVAEGTLTTDISLGENSTSKYDAFYHFHNDILHTIMSDRAAQNERAQYLTLEISAG